MGRLKVVKDNKMNRITFYNSTIQLKIFSKIILEIRKKNNKNIFRLAINDLIDEFNFSEGDYLGLKKICRKMFVPIELPTERKHGFSLNALFIKIDTDEQGYVSFEINPGIKDYILEQTENFTSYFLENIANLNSTYSLRIYELLKQYQQKETLRGFYKVRIDDLRTILNIDDKKYKLYGHFKDKVLRTAQQELEAKTDLCFTFEEIKNRRKVDTLIFHIQYNNKKVKRKDAMKAFAQSKNIKQIEQNQELKNTEIYKFLRSKLDLEHSFIVEIFDKYDKEKLKRNLEYVVKKIKNDEIQSNISEFLRRALEEDFASII